MILSKTCITPFNSGGERLPPDTNSSGQQAFLMIGDSTSAGSNNSGGTGGASPAGTAYYYRRATTDIVEMTNDVVTTPLGTQYPFFANAYYTGTGYKAVIIPTGVGGSNFSPRTGDSGDWSTADVLYANAVTDANNAMSILGVNKLKYIFITSLGINDARGATALSTIESDIQSLITRLQTDFPNTPILIEQIGRDETAVLTPRIGTIRGYLKAICENNTNIHMLGSLPSFAFAGYYGGDLLHPSQTGNNVRGQMLARFMLNDTRNKWSRSIIASHFDELSTARKDAISTLVDNNLTDYLNHDLINLFKTTTQNNAYLDWAFMNSPNRTGYVFTANSQISTNGVSTYARDFFIRSMSSYKSSQNDGFHAVKLKVNTTGASASTLGAYGAFDGTTAISIFQVNGGVVYKFNDNTVTTDTTETFLADNSEYLTGRNGTSKYLYKNGSQVDTVTQASNGNCAVQGYVGVNNNNGTAAGFLNATWEYQRAGKFSAVNQATFKAAMDTYLAAI